MIKYEFNNHTNLNISIEQNSFLQDNNNFIILNSCAGSGKTRCLILKINKLIEEFNISSNDIIVCTYTKVLTSSIKFRIKYHFDNLFDKALIGTFHSICYQLIKSLFSSEVISYQNKPIDFNLDLTSPEEILVYTYEQIVKNNIILKNKYLFIDEFQDLTPMQQKIINHLLLFKKIKGLFLFGDPNQSIYSFCINHNINKWLNKLQNIKIGENKILADSKYQKLKKLNIIMDDQIIDESISSFDSFSKLNLKTNFRSSLNIINLANCFLDDNYKMISNYNNVKQQPIYYLFNKWSDEINFLIEVIINYLKNERFKSHGSFAVISRYNKTLELIEDKLLKLDIYCNYIKYNNIVQHDAINLCTIHSSKGLEFNNIYFVNSSYHIDQLDEECRLLYVCLTRAKKQIIISSNRSINKLISEKVLDDDNNKQLIDFQDKRTHINKLISDEDKIINNLNVSTIKDRIKSWIGVTDLIKLLGGEHIIAIKRILAPILTFKPEIRCVHKCLFVNNNKKIPKCFTDIKNITNTQNVFGIFIDALTNREVQYKLNKKIIEYPNLNKLILLNYLNDQTNIESLKPYQIEQLKNIYRMSDSIFKSNILLDKSSYNFTKINKEFDQQLRDSYFRFTDTTIQTIDIVYDIFIVSLSNSVLNERLAYQYLPRYIKSDDINELKEWYTTIINYIDDIVDNNPSILVQKELSNHYMKIIGYCDIIIEDKQLIIDVKTSIFENPKLEYLLQIIIYGMLNDTPINKYQIYNPIYGNIYEWNCKGDCKNKLIDYISSILSNINKKREYTI